MALATLQELTDRLEWELDLDEVRAATGALEELSDQALFHGKTTWDALNVPRLVKNTVLAAAARHMRNPDGYVQSRAGDETLGWTDRGHDAGSAYFTEREVKMIRSIAGRTGFVSAQVSAWGPQKQTVEGYVPIESSPDEKPFPMFAEGTW